MSADEEKNETVDLQPEKMKVNELKTLLNDRGLDTKGVKAVLVSRLRQALAEEDDGGGGDDEDGIKIDNVESLQKQAEDERITDTGQNTNTDRIDESDSSKKLIEESESDHKSELMALIDRAIVDDKPEEASDLSEEKSKEKDLHISNQAPEATSAPYSNLEETVKPIEAEEKIGKNLVQNESAPVIGNGEEKKDSEEELDRKLSKEEEEMKLADATTSKECTQLKKVSTENMEEEEKTDIMDDIIKTMDTLTETLDKSKGQEEVKVEEAERDLSKVEPNRDADEIVVAGEVIIKNPEDVQLVEKLSRELNKLKVIVLELTNFFPDFQPRSKEKLLLCLPFKDKKTLDDKDMEEFKTALNQLDFSSNLSNSGVTNLAELLASVSSVRLVKDKLGKLIRNVADLSDQLVDYAGHLKRKRARREEEEKRSKSKEVEGETIGKDKVAIFRRKGDFPIIGVSERDISPIRENFDIKKVKSKFQKKLLKS